MLNRALNRLLSYGVIHLWRRHAESWGRGAEKDRRKLRTASCALKGGLNRWKLTCVDVNKQKKIMHTFIRGIHIYWSFCLLELVHTAKFALNSIQRLLVKAWNGYHLNRESMLKPKTEEDKEVLQRARFCRERSS